MRAAVVICCYTERRLSDILAAIASVRCQQPAPRLVLVIDHNPRLAETLGAQFPDLTIAESHHRRGLSGARNTGLELCDEDVVAFLDDDAVAEPGWLAALLVEYDDDRVIAVGGHIEPRWDAGRPRWFPPEFDWVVGCSYTGQPTRRAVVRNVIGANMSFRRLTALEVGGFGEALGRVGANTAGCEETELCVRATQHTGGLVVHRPDARVGHRVTVERSSLRYFVRRCYAEGRSKATVARLVGSDEALVTERSYVVRILGTTLRRGVTDAVRWRRTAPLRRSAAIVAGLFVTLAGFVVGSIRPTAETAALAAREPLARR